MEKTGRYTFLAEPFHCDFSHRLFMGHLGNHLLNAADFHAADRNFGMTRLNPIHRTWVLSRLAIEMDEMPAQYSRFTVETWVESAMRYFTNRNFHIVAEDGRTLGYGRSVWAMIDTDTRQPADLLAIDDGAINAWIDKERGMIYITVRDKKYKYYGPVCSFDELKDLMIKENLINIQDI